MCDAFPFGICIRFETRLDVCTRENGAFCFYSVACLLNGSMCRRNVSVCSVRAEEAKRDASPTSLLD